MTHRSEAAEAEASQGGEEEEEEEEDVDKAWHPIAKYVYVCECELTNRELKSLTRHDVE